LEGNRSKYNRTDIRMTLDYLEDYKFFQSVMVGLGKQKKSPTFSNIIDYLTDHPEVVKINSELESVYEEHLKSSMLGMN
jgi:spore coat polysaccharide biosynthesis protein SpsF (cytidylyltransferase family)